LDGQRRRPNRLTRSRRYATRRIATTITIKLVTHLMHAKTGWSGHFDQPAFVHSSCVLISAVVIIKVFGTLIPPPLHLV
jgi:hypothetical protein